MKDKKGNLILVWNYTNWGGAQIYFLSVIRELPADWNLKVVLPRDSSVDFLKFLDNLKVGYEFLENKIDSEPALTFGRKIKRQWRRIKAEFETYNFLKRFKNDNNIFHLESAPWQSWILLFLLTRRGSVFVTIHNALGNHSKWRERLWKKRLNFLCKQKNFYLFTANQHALDEFKKRIDKKYRDKLILTRASINPVEINNVLESNFDRTKLLESLGFSDKDKIILAVGQFIDRKGRWIFLEAARQIIEKHPRTGFVWLMPELPDVEGRRKIESFNLGNSFQAVKSSSVGAERTDVLGFFRVADIFALPSLLEGLPIAILEAMALGICTVSTDVNAIPEAVKDMETGILIKPDDGYILADALDKLISDDDLRMRLAENGREFVLENFDDRFWANEVIKHYKNSLEDHTSK